LAKICPHQIFALKRFSVDGSANRLRRLKVLEGLADKGGVDTLLRKVQALFL